MNVNPAARLSIVAYKPKLGKNDELLALARHHAPYLRQLGLATERASIVAKAADGTIVEVFEWVEGGLEKAHSHPGIMDLWTRFMNVCDFIPLQTLQEASTIFAGFTPVD